MALLQPPGKAKEDEKVKDGEDEEVEKPKQKKSRRTDLKVSFQS